MSQAYGTLISSDRRPGRVPAIERALPWLAIAAAFVHALALSWRKWGDLLVDTGRELDIPRRLAEGQLVYRDIRFHYPPLPPYINAALYRIFGVHLDVLVWAGIASAALMCAGLYRLARFFIPRWASAAVVITFIYTCAFAHLYAGPTFNFVLPYTFSATYGIVLATWGVVFLIAHVRTETSASFYASAAFLGLAALSKLEVLAPAAATHAMFVATFVVQRPRRPAVYLVGYLATAAALVAVYGGLALRVGPGLLRGNLMDVVNQVRARKFVLWAMGFSDTTVSWRAMGLSLLLLASAFALAWLAARLVARAGAKGLVTAGALAAVASASFLGFRSWQLHVHFRALPLIMVAVIVTLLAIYWKQPQRRSEWLAHLLLWVFGFAALWRIILNARPHHYGFYLLPPGLVCLGVLFFDYGPRLAGKDSRSSRFFAAAGLGLLASSVSLAYVDSSQLYALHTYDLVTPRGRLRILNRWGLEGPAVHVLSQLPPGSRALAVPEGPGLLFFAGLREADTMSSYLPMELVGDKADEELLARWMGDPPDFVVWTARSLAEFGSSGFGADYASRSMAWLLREYLPVTNPASPIVVMQRRQAMAGARFFDLRPSPEPPGTRQTMVGKVLETFTSAGVTFLRVQTNSSKVWVAVREAKVDVGSMVTVVDAQPGGLDESELRRRFDRLLYGRLEPPRSTTP